MKVIFTLLALSVFSAMTQPVYSASFTNHGFSMKTGNGDKKKEISIVSNRKSGDIQLRFTADKEGKATITIVNESGKIVLQQTSQVLKCINTIPLKNATGLAEGPYTVRLISNNETYTTRFLIWK